MASEPAEGPQIAFLRPTGELAQDIGRSRGGRTSKVHVAVNESGRPLRLAISGGHVHDSQMM